jgi:hypothetical protein
MAVVVVEDRIKREEEQDAMRRRREAWKGGKEDLSTMGASDRNERDSRLSTVSRRSSQHIANKHALSNRENVLHTRNKQRPL